MCLLLTVNLSKRIYITAIEHKLKTKLECSIRRNKNGIKCNIARRAYLLQYSKFSVKSNIKFTVEDKECL